jgi:hypothetical protein
VSRYTLTVQFATEAPIRPEAQAYPLVLGHQMVGLLFEQDIPVDIERVTLMQDGYERASHVR